MVSFMLTPGEAESAWEVELEGVKKSSKIEVRPRQKTKAGPGRDCRFIPTHLPHVLLILQTWNFFSCRMFWKWCIYGFGRQIWPTYLPLPCNHSSFLCLTRSLCWTRVEVTAIKKNCIVRKCIVVVSFGLEIMFSWQEQSADLAWLHDILLNDLQWHTACVGVCESLMAVCLLQ